MIHYVNESARKQLCAHTHMQAHTHMHKEGSLVEARPCSAALYPALAYSQTFISICLKKQPCFKKIKQVMLDRRTRSGLKYPNSLTPIHCLQANPYPTLQCPRHFCEHEATGTHRQRQAKTSSCEKTDHGTDFGCY